MSRFSIDSAAKDSQGFSRNVSRRDLVGIMGCCARLLDELGETAEYVEVMRVRPGFGAAGKIFFNIDVVMNIGDSEKPTAEFQIHPSRTLNAARRPDWNEIERYISGAYPGKVKSTLRDFIKQRSRLYDAILTEAGLAPLSSM